MTEPVPRRVVVTGPRSPTVRRPPGRQGLQALDEQTAVGELLVRSLVRAQLGLALRTAGVVALVLGGLPLLFALVPTTRDTRVLGLALPWLVLAVLVYPALVLTGWVHVRLAERYEREFVELVDT
ncbi:MAG: hypothetical protein JWN17_2305 [Frankiales bacterium]|nr:hypothetical protein [Frankiales bacterium]